MKPTIDELRAMAERVAKVRAAEIVSSNELVSVYTEMYGEGESWNHGRMDDDEFELTDFACELLDQRPLTPENLQEMGAKLVYDSKNSDGTTIEQWRFNPSASVWFLGDVMTRCNVDGNGSLYTINTIGQFKALCLASGVELKKGGE